MFKKTILILILTIFVSVLSANILIDVYHSNYGLIDRTVLVFDSKPDYSIFTEKSSIWVTIANCRKDIALRDKILQNNQTIEGYKYQVAKSEMKFVININSSVQEANNYDFDFKLFELQEDVFKIVFDIFATSSPQTPQEFQSYVNFYEKVGEIGLSNKYKQLQRDYETGQPIQNVVQTQEFSKEKNINQQPNEIEPKEIPSKEETLVNKVASEKVDQAKKPISSFPKLFETAFVGFIGLNFFILLILFLSKKLKKKEKKEKKKKKKSKTKNVTVDDFRSTDGIADRDFMKEIITKLAEFGWENDEISKELNLDLFTLEQLRLADLSEDEWAN